MVRVIALGRTVADLDGNLGLVIGPERYEGPGVTVVTVEWDDHVSQPLVDDLLTEYDMCEHGGLAGSPGRCDMDTAPGHTRCEAHGGASPIDVRVVRA